MPTGYTHLIQQDISFKKFVMACARNFGALVTMRDTPMDAKIPEEFEPCDYHKKELEEIEKRLECLKKMVVKEAHEEAEKEYKEKLKYKEERIREYQKIRKKYLNMRTKVKQWNPPTEDHKGLKGFMVEQIENSIKFDCNEDYWINQRITKLSGENWRDKEIHKALKDLSYHKKGWEEEKARVADRNQWLKALRYSLSHEKE